MCGEGEEPGLVVGDQGSGAGTHTGGVGLEELLSLAGPDLPSLGAPQEEHLIPIQAAGTTQASHSRVRDVIRVTMKSRNGSGA